MHVRLLKDVEVKDEAGKVRYTLPEGSIHDWREDECLPLLDQGQAEPADAEAAAYFAKFVAAMKDGTVDPILLPKVARYIEVRDAGKGADATA